MPEYDYIIAGGGCAGLSLVVHILGWPGSGDKKILLIDRSSKLVNDRTWCFWERGAGLFESIVYRSWDRLAFYGRDDRIVATIDPYRYKMIRGIDFYDHCLTAIRRAPGVTMVQGAITGCVSGPGVGGTFVEVEGRRYTGEYIFNSVMPAGPGKPDASAGEDANRYWSLLQHFKGWVIEAEQGCFDPGQATLMDFRVDQGNGAAFVYTLPLSDRSALVEYTVFSAALLSAEDYAKGLRDYIRDILGIAAGAYTIREEEYGVIPMTDRPFPSRQYNMLYIGTAGGRTKPSSGYTFQYIQKQSRAIAAALSTGTGLSGVPEGPRRFGFYDSVLLNVLGSGKLSGERVFTDLFRKNGMQDIFSFLDNESELLQELRIIGSLPTWPFLKAGLEELL